jgi:hypothetical protein
MPEAVLDARIPLTSKIKKKKHYFQDNTGRSKRKTSCE